MILQHGAYTADVFWHREDSSWTVTVRETGDKFEASSYHEADAYFRALVDVLTERAA